MTASVWIFDFNGEKKALCQSCGFIMTYEKEWPGPVEHDCDSDKYPPITDAQGRHIAGKRDHAAQNQFERLNAETKKKGCGKCDKQKEIKAAITAKKAEIEKSKNKNI